MHKGLKSELKPDRLDSSVEEESSFASDNYSDEFKDPDADNKDEEKKDEKKNFKRVNSWPIRETIKREYLR